MMSADKQTRSIHRSGNQPSGTTLPEGKPKSSESKENPLGAGISGNTHPAGEEGHRRLPEGSSVTTGEQSSTYRRMRHNNS